MVSSIGIVKVDSLQGRAKLLAEAEGLKPDDLIILTISIEKIVGDPVSYLLSKVQNSASSQGSSESETK